MTSFSRLGLLHVVLASAALIGFALLAPSSIGGAASWVITSGTSMEPILRGGDLVIARPRSEYQVGDVVAYPSETLGDTVVLHRVVADRPDGFVTQGDNNDWLDPDRPQTEQILGAMWLHIPGGGRMLTVLADPLVIAALVATLLTAGGVFTRRRARRRGARRADGSVTRKTRPTSSWSVREWAAVSGVGALALAFLAFGRPVVTAPSDEIEVTHTAAVGYSAVATDSDIYAEDKVRTGDPVFLAVTPLLATHLRYRISPRADVSGTIHTTARVTASNGWERSVPVGAASHFRGSRTQHTVTVDLAQLRGMVERAEGDAGITFGGYTLEIVHDVHVQGRIAGEAVNTDYQPKLTFVMDDVQAVLQGSNAQQAQADAVVLTGEDTVASPATAGPAFTVLRWHVPVSILQVLAVTVAVASLVFVGAAARRRRAPGQPHQIFGRRLVQASEVDIAGRVVVDVDGPAALLRVARLYDTAVIHVRRSADQSFYVTADNTLYRYDDPTGDDALAAPLATPYGVASASGQPA